MKKYLLFLFIAFSAFASAQQITASDSVGCAPMVGVQFNGIAGSTNISWDFNDGGFANILNPVHTFSSPGTYTVTYSATVNGSTVNQTIPIVVHGKPTPGFTTTSATSGCVPLTVSFQNQSVGSGGAAITSSSWAFGDGGVSNAANPNYTYTIGGVYSVSLVVMDANGCDSSITTSNVVKVSKKPVPVITATPDPIASCTPPLNVTYSASASTSNSTSSSTLLYSWVFGNGNTSTAVNPPQQTYSTNGNFTVKLIVTDDNGCKDSITKPVSINNPLASFSVGDTVCRFVSFINNSTPGVKQWNYGDGFTGVLDTHTYANPGIYFVTLTITSGSCSHDTTRKIVIQDIKADFTFTPTYSCSLPQTLNLTNTSLNGYTYSWSVNPGENITAYGTTLSSPTATNPTITVTKLDTSKYTVWDRDTVTEIQLVLITRQGCTDTITKVWLDTLYLPTARYQPDVAEGCVPLTVQFSDSSKSKEQIVSWEYFFGDGATYSSATSGVISHTYTNVGIYYPILIIVNSAGCRDTSYEIPIRVGSPPNVDFSVSPTTACVHTPIQFTNLTTATNNSPVDTWHYYTDNGFIMSSCYTDPNPTWSFQSGVGVQDVTMVACSRGCCTEVTKSNLIDIKGPLAEYTAKMDCDSPEVFTFIGNIKDASFWTWDFGDGTVITNSTADTIMHTYADTGQYTTTMIAFNPSTGCAPDTFSLKIWVERIKAVITTDTSACTLSRHIFNGGSSENVHTYGSNGYVWIWDDNTPPAITSSDTTGHSFTGIGLHTIKLIVADHNGCRDTATKVIYASKVDAGYLTDKIYFCVPGTINFTDQSLSDTTITAWNWTFGDGGNGTGQATSHNYTDANANYFNVKIEVTNVLGCKDTLTKKIYPSKPVATFFLMSSTYRCAGDSVRFMAAVNNHADYDWDFGDGGSSGAQIPWHTYATPGVYSVSLTVTDSIGCQKTNTIPNLVQIQGVPQVGFYSSVDTLTERCYPLTVTFTDTSIANVFGSRTWDLGNGSPVVPSQTVGTIYQAPGNYSVSLIVSTTFGCKDTIEKVINVQGPLADFDLAPNRICKGQQVNFQIDDTSGVALYHWDFGDGFDTSNVSPVTHTYNIHPQNGVLSATLIFYGTDSSCAKTKTQTIQVEQVIADFKRNDEIALPDTSHCLGPQDLFTNSSTNASTWAWSFGDGTTSMLNNPTHTYTSPGTFNVQLSITNAATGCVDTMRKTMIINPLPVVNATGGDTCQDKGVQLTSSGGVNYLWTPSTFLSSDTIANPNATPTQTTTYTVNVSDGNGCAGFSTAIVNIIPRPEVVHWDTTIIIGQFVPLIYNYQSYGYIYSWSPTDSLSCVTCPNPTSHPMEDIKYVLTVSDSFGCFTEYSYYDIYVKPETSIDVPSAFTPNGDGYNDKVYVRGWGIKELIEFNIYNRFGELVFSTTDIETGWDGTYKGVPQGTESFAYTVKVETYVVIDGQVRIEEKKGFVKLLR